MAAESIRDQTYPHDYRLICAGREAPTVVGGQAVNLWAVSYLQPDGPDLRADEFGSKDLDILADKPVLDYLKTVPGWVFKPNITRNWTDSRKGFLHGTSEDGRKLLVEVLHSVHGLDQADLAHVEIIEHRDNHYRLLDPIVMLKAKAANVRDIKQDDMPPRHDRAHLQLLARCLPLYLRDVHEAAVKNAALEKDSLVVISRAFKTLQHSKTAQTLVKEGISPAGLVPPEFAASPLPRIRSAYEWQFRLLTGATTRMEAKRVASAPAQVPLVAPPPPAPRQGPRIGL